MKVKKFICHKCGAPKVNAYEGVYVVCDYCNTIVDIDYTSSVQVIEANPERQERWSKFYYEYTIKAPQYLAEGNKKAHRQLHYDYCIEYFTAFPDSLPPNVPNGEVFEQYCQASADFMTGHAFNPNMQQLKANYEKLYAQIEYYEKNGQLKARYEQFAGMLDAYMEMVDLEISLLYGNPDYELFNEYYPEEFNRKQRISQIAQMWIPYLEEPYAGDFLKKYHLASEYVEINPPEVTEIQCGSCNKNLKVPQGAITCVCKYCRHQNYIKTHVNCNSCGNQNTLPEKWKMMINCTSCGTELRVVQPLFG
jgi:ribosomal protein S27E